MNFLLKYSAYVLLFIMIVFFQKTSLSQIVFSIDISDPTNTTGYAFNNSLDAAGSDVYLKIEPGIFDRVLLNRGSGYVCTINYPTANRFQQVYDSLVYAFGYENEIHDNLPAKAINYDIAEIVMLIQNGEAEIIRYWYRDKFNVKLQFNNENLKVYIAYA